jgi:hypothetical protein
LKKLVLCKCGSGPYFSQYPAHDFGESVYIAKI